MEPSRTLYVALLGIPTLGTLSSNIMNAPLHTIQTDLDAGPSGIVLAVSAFTIAMVMCVPVAGWLCDRFGAKKVLVYSLTVMIVAEAGAALAQDLPMLVAARTLQGIGCSAIPPGVLQPLTRLWPERQAASTAAWASASGLGQAIGPPFGGLITEVAGWRFVFIVHAVFCAAVILILLKSMPATNYGRPPIHAAGLTCLIVGIGSLVIGFTLSSQHASGPLAVAVLIAGAAGIGLYTLIAARNPLALVAPKALYEQHFIRSTASASTSMFVLGVCIVVMPLYLAVRLDLQPGAVGLVLLGLAAAMTGAAPLSPRLSTAFSARRVLQSGLFLLMASAIALGFLTTIDGTVPVWPFVLALVLTGVGLAFTQSISALGITRSEVGQRGMALGIHNMVRFAGMAAGYAWVAATYSAGGLWLTFAGAAVAAAIALISTVLSFETRVTESAEVRTEMTGTGSNGCHEE
jgi:MFS family permease